MKRNQCTCLRSASWNTDETGHGFERVHKGNVSRFHSGMIKHRHIRLTREISRTHAIVQNSRSVPFLWFLSCRVMSECRKQPTHTDGQWMITSWTTLRILLLAPKLGTTFPIKMWYFSLQTPCIIQFCYLGRVPWGKLGFSMRHWNTWWRWLQ